MDADPKERRDRLSPGQYSVRELPVLHYKSIPEIDVSKWRIRISSLVEEERIMSYQEILSLPQVKVVSDVHCVTGWSKLDSSWEGVSTHTILSLVGVRPEAKHVVVRSADDYTTNISLEDFLKPDSLLAVKYNCKTLTPEHGYPLRLVIPSLYFWKSAKWITKINFLREREKGYWELRGYHNRGDPLEGGKIRVVNRSTTHAQLYAYPGVHP